MTILFCAYRDWALHLFSRLRIKHKQMLLFSPPKKLTYNYVKKLNPDFIFFPDWSWMVPSKIIDNFKCICIHESDLPKFRGGSPIQNQIIKNITKTKSTAFQMTNYLDAGPILLQKSLSLKGSIDEIFQRMIENDYELIDKIINNKFKPKSQNGKSTIFKRRTPKQSELLTLDYSKEYLYNFIRMLSDPYPNSYIKIGKRKIIFKSSNFDGKKLSFNGEIE